jgi:CBS domain-containing protein
MLVSDILKHKGSDVKVVNSNESALFFAQRLRDEHVGAMVVSDDGQQIDGIISERDVAYGLAAYGAELHSVPVSRLMTKVVITCKPQDSIAEVMRLMTQKRIRHVPVSEGNRLVGLVSSGDVLKHRLDEMQLEANVLRDYAVARR